MNYARGLINKPINGFNGNAYGYPYNPPYPEGEVMYGVPGTISGNESEGNLIEMKNNDFTGGASGGPWFINYNGTIHVGGINAKNIYGTVQSPYFSSIIQRLIDAVMS